MYTSVAWLVWPEALPLEATITRRVEVTPPAGFGAKLRLVPRVLLYPFGWSTWISLQITGEHRIDGLGALVAHLFGDMAFHHDAEAF